MNFCILKPNTYLTCNLSEPKSVSSLLTNIRLSGEFVQTYHFLTCKPRNEWGSYSLTTFENGNFLLQAFERLYRNQWFGFLPFQYFMTSAHRQSGGQGGGSNLVTPHKSTSQNVRCHHALFPIPRLAHREWVQKWMKRFHKMYWASSKRFGKILSCMYNFQDTWISRSLTINLLSNEGRLRRIKIYP